MQYEKVNSLIYAHFLFLQVYQKKYKYVKCKYVKWRTNDSHNYASMQKPSQAAVEDLYKWIQKAL